MPESKSKAEQWAELVRGFRLTMLKRDAMIAAAKANPALLIDLIEENRNSPAALASGNFISNSTPSKANSPMAHTPTPNATAKWNELVARMARVHGAASAHNKAVLADLNLYGDFLREEAENKANTPEPQHRQASAREEWNLIVAQHKRNMPAARAVSKAVRENPELHQAMLREVNAR